MTSLLQSFRIRLHWLVALLMALCLVAMTALVAGLTQVRLHASAQEAARDMFSQVAQRNAQKLQDVLTTTGNAVQFLASMPLTGVDGAGRIDRPRITALLLAAVQAQPQLDSVYISFGSDEMLQAIGIGHRPRLKAAFAAPAGSHFALRTIERNPANPQERRESWIFLDARGVRMGERAATPVSYAASQRPWYRQARQAPGLQLTQAYEMASAGALGVSLVQASAVGDGVVAADLVLSEFDQFAGLSLSGQEGGVVLANGGGELLGHFAGPEFSDLPVQGMEPLARSANPFVAAAAALAQQDASLIQTVQGQEMVYARSPVDATPTSRLWVTAFAPVAPFAAPLRSVQRELL